MFRKAMVSDCAAIKRVMDENVVPTWPEENVRYAVENENSRFFVIEEDGEIEGYACVETVLDEATLTSVAVIPAKRRRGLAEKLLSGIFDGLAEVRTVYLEVETTNAAAIGLYNKMGFKEIGRRKNYYGPNDAVIMSLQLYNKKGVN